eukprot:tig00020563_g11366.t1
MGVRGLHTWLRNRKDAGEELRLRSGTSKRLHVVIDGNSLCFHLYYNTPDLDVGLAGSYPAFAQAVQHFFRTVIECGVDPVVFMDGTVEEIKRATVVRRGAESIRRANRLLDGAGADSPSGSVLPLLALDVFRYCLLAEGVPLRQTAGEADLAIARYACDPATGSAMVWSNDSDFYVFPDLPGYAPLETLSHDSETGVLKMAVYRPARTAASLGVDAALLPVLACLAGNDFLEESVLRRAHAGLLPAAEAGRTGWGLLEALARWAARHSRGEGPAARAAALAEVFATRLGSDPGERAAFEGALGKYACAACVDREAEELEAGAAAALGPRFVDEYRRGLHSADLISVACRRELWLGVPPRPPPPLRLAPPAPAPRRVAEYARAGGEYAPQWAPADEAAPPGETAAALLARPAPERLRALLAAFAAGGLAELAPRPARWCPLFASAVALRLALSGPEPPLRLHEAARRAFLHAAALLQAGVQHVLLLNECLGFPVGTPSPEVLPFDGPAAFAWYRAPPAPCIRPRLPASRSRGYRYEEARGSAEGAQRAREACGGALRSALLAGVTLPGKPTRPAPPPEGPAQGAAGEKRAARGQAGRAAGPSNPFSALALAEEG